MYTAIPSTIMQTQPPDADVMIRLKSGWSAPNLEIIAVSSDSIDTIAAVRLIALEADNTGLPCFLYLITLTIAVMVI